MTHCTFQLRETSAIVMRGGGGLAEGRSMGVSFAFLGPTPIPPLYTLPLRVPHRDILEDRPYPRTGQGDYAYGWYG